MWGASLTESRDTVVEDWERVWIGPLTLALPPEWTVDLTEYGAVLQHPEVGEFFRPNVVVRHAVDARPIEAISARSIEAELQLNPTVHYSHVGVWETGDGNGRHHRFGYTSNGMGIIVNRWLGRDGSHAVELVASCQLIQSSDMEPTFAAIAASVESRGEIRLPNAIPTQEDDGWRPRLDEDATAAHGQPRESLAGLRRAARFTSEGPVLSTAAMDYLLSHADQSRIGRLEDQDSPEIAELRATGLVTPDGAYSSELRALLVPVRECAFVIHVTGAGRGAVTSLTLYVGAGAVFAAAGPSRDQILDPAEGGLTSDMLQIDLLRGESVPSEIAAWAGLLPAWCTAAHRFAVDQEAYGRHVMDGPEQDREDYAEMVGGRVWDQPWFQWSVAIDPVGPILDLTSCGEAGQFDSDFRASPIRMRYVGTEEVWTRLTESFVACLATLPDRSERERLSR